MDLKEYFTHVSGFGTLATADVQGRVNLAVYARPHVLVDGTLAVIMRDRLSHHNLQSNPHAAYLFREAGDGYRGRRFHLTKISEEKDTARIDELKRRHPSMKKDADGGPLFLVVFQVDRILPLIGSGD
ncbi:MAG: pyridoxamine 5'-phosphate oxidase family protein [Candidatus Competibacteraceae bacterium]